MVMDFRRGSQGARTESGVRIGSLLFLGDAEKEQMCLDLLEEFGAKNVRDGRNGELIHSCCLPFGLHANGDANPSASLNWQKLVYHCYGCGNGGGLAWFIATCRGEDVEQVRKWVEDRTSIETEAGLQGFLKYLDALYSPKATVKPQIPKFNPAIMDPWLEFVHPYLTEFRHIPRDNVVRHKVGWDQSLDRIVFPHFWKGDLVGWQSRRIVNDGTPKYKSTPDFPKDQTIYCNPGTYKEPIVVVESPISVVSKDHLTPMVATFGASVTEKQIKLIGNYRMVLLWFDNDNAGWEATKRVGSALSRYTDVFVVDCDLAADPADMDDNTFRDVVAVRTPFALWTPPTHLKEYRRLQEFR
jgi:Toprim-like/CHC2 zinc finger